ncbi:dienelactone hydrolase family protein [Chitinophaga sp. MD30]|uniref:carboxylesterase family protein n=1 Tax=Chitinophaga sp. MD30 TaxID=2033437 RepID=UPI0012FD2DCB|nr:dienelactone hydrolase family protein [Chitinophaga sp. MD30]
MREYFSQRNWACYVLYVFLLYLALPAVAQQQAAKSVPSSISNIVGYYEHLPQGYATNTSQRYPLIIFLHGVGELAGNNATQINQNVLKNGIPNYIRNNQFPASFTVGGQSYSFIVLTPQFKVWPGSDDVNKLLAYAESVYRVDSSRVYVTGISMGGGVAWGVLSENAVKAKQYAAAAIVCGAWDPDSRPSLANVIAANNTPVWAFHNDNDPTVSSTWSKNWVKLINASVPAPNPPALLTIFQSNSHDAWTKAFDPAYKDPQTGTNVYEWMLKYKQGGAPNPVNGGRRIVVPRSRGNAIYYEDAKTALNVQPGDTLCINAGDYDFIHMGNLVGTAAKPIIIRNCGGLVRVGVNSTTTVASFLLPGGQYFKVEGDGHPGLRYGFDINGTSATGVKLFGLLFSSGASDFEVHHCYVHDAGMFLQAKTLQNCQQPQFLEGAFVMRNVKIHDLLCRNSAWEGFYIGNTHYLWDDGNCKSLKSHHLENLRCIIMTWRMWVVTGYRSRWRIWV